MAPKESEISPQICRYKYRSVECLLAPSKLFLLIGAALLIAACSKTPEGVGPSEAPPETPGSVLVAPVTVTSPLGPVLSNSSQLSVSGSCLIGTTVVMVGDAKAIAGCSTGSFSFPVRKTSDGSFSFGLIQGFSSTRASELVEVTWTRDSTPPTAPTIATPSRNPYYFNGGSITLTGTCENDSTVTLSGASSASTTCSSGAYSFSVSKATDGTFDLAVSQTDAAGNTSQATTLAWIRDGTPPAAPTVDSPSSNPFTSSDSSVFLSGTCETGALVNLSGAGTDQDTCVNGSYEFSLNQSSAGNYTYQLNQTDKAGNTSATTTFQWTIDSSLPSTPVITFPATASYDSNASSLTITGTCTDGYTVNISGALSSTATCSSSQFSFTSNQTSDGNYNYSITQTNGLSLTSAAATLLWRRDATAPAAPGKTAPASSPMVTNQNTLNISGTCETNATVNLSGSSTDSASCSSGTYNFSVSKAGDGTYSFSISQTDRAGNTSATISQVWTRDATLPSPVTITNHTSPYVSNGNSLILSGACETGATVTLAGGASATATCSLNSYSFTINQSTDATLVFELYQTDPAGNASSSRFFTWQRDTQAPAAPVLSSPASNPFASSGSTIVISGTCENSASVQLSGDQTSSATCASNSFSFTVTKPSDGTYHFTLNQTDLAGNTSSNTTLDWTLSSAIPSTPVITSPTTNPYYSKANSVTVTGTCVTGYLVELQGDASLSQTCASNTFSFTVSKSIDASYSFNIRQKSITDLYSGTITFVWVRDTVAPSAPSITSPSSSPAFTSGDSLTISGTCETGATVALAGDSNSNTACRAGTYSFSVSKSTDGTYNFVVKQTDLAGNVSGSSSQSWTRDTVSPSAVSIYSPNSNPFISGDTTISIKGNCELKSKVVMSGDFTGEAQCSSLGDFNFNITKSIDGTVNVSLLQMDLAGNSSSALAFQWIRDTSVPPTPTLLSPTTNPFYSNSSTLTLTVACDDTLQPFPAVVNLYGDVTASEVTSPAGSLSQNCTSSPVTFVIRKTIDGIYDFNLDQDNPQASTTSNATSIRWVRDTVAPAAPIITNPTQDPLTSPGSLEISGNCETNATVSLSGDSVQSQLCAADNTFLFNVLKTVDGTYHFLLSQSDLAGNTSASADQTWVRNSVSVGPPVITAPASSPVRNNASSLTVSGTCTTDATVSLAGDVSASDISNPTGSLTQTCQGGTFTYVIEKSIDASYTFSFTQSLNGLTSSAANLVWIRDTVAPTVAFTSTPAATNINTVASFSFSSTDTSARFECSLDSAAFATCTSPVSYSTLSNAGHTFSVRPIDLAGNTGTTQNDTWTQAAYKTLALYHLNSGSQTSDSSYFTQLTSYVNNLAATGSPTNDTSGKYPSSSPSSQAFGTGKYLSCTSNASLNAGISTMTVEGFLKITTDLSTNGDYYTLVSKTSNSSPNFGWELRLKRVSGKYALEFVGSTTGASAGTVVTSSTFTLNTNKWNYFAVTWNKGTVNLYFGLNSATSRGSGTIGSSGSSLASTTAPLRLGANATSGTGTSKWFAGSLDEVRISQVVRTISIPNGEFSPD